jgi:hypothetical protein
MRIRRQPAHTPGLVGHALDADLIEKTLWTVSAWTNNTELNQFDQTDPHRSIKCTIRSAMCRRPFVFPDLPRRRAADRMGRGPSSHQ